MRKIFVISDTHFCHAKVLTFTGKDGSLIRPNFKSVDDMDNTIIQNWNKTVTANDIVYHLGDVTFGNIKSNLARIMPQLAGTKRLILGNHDYNAKDYQPYFQKIMSWRQFGKEFSRPIVLCHFPLHIDSFAYRAGGNALCVHGHIHEKSVNDSRYVNVAVEKTNYTPIALEDIADGKFSD